MIFDSHSQEAFILYNPLERPIGTERSGRQLSATQAKDQPDEEVAGLHETAAFLLERKTERNYKYLTFYAA